jgi:hypothetical protein
MKHRALKSDVQISATRNKYCNLKTSRWVKLGTLFYATLDTLKQTFFLHSKDTKIRHKRNYYVLRATKTKPKK